MSTAAEPFFSEKVISFYRALRLQLPEHLQTTVLNPYCERNVMDYVQQFFRKYYNNHRTRTFLFGINPGRLGSGATGISFTDPVALRKYCGIENDLGDKRELSSEFIYQVIEAYGGAEKYYKRFFMTAICPLGFLKGLKNYNYYDDQNLLAAVLPFITAKWKEQIRLGAKYKVAICIGSGKNKKMITTLNQAYPYFEKIIFLEHPRFIMQYRRKRMAEYIDAYLEAMESA